MPSRTAANYYGTALKGASATSSQTIHNGSDYEKLEPKAPLSTWERAQSIPYANRVLRGYVNGGISLMPPPNQSPGANGPKASLLEGAIVDAQNYYGVYKVWKAQV